MYCSELASAAAGTAPSASGLSSAGTRPSGSPTTFGRPGAYKFKQLASSPGRTRSISAPSSFSYSGD